MCFVLRIILSFFFFSFQLLYDFVLSHEDSKENFLLNTNYPRKTFPLLHNENKTLEDVGIKSNTALFVQNMDDESSDEDDL